MGRGEGALPRQLGIRGTLDPALGLDPGAGFFLWETWGAQPLSSNTSAHRPGTVAILAVLASLAAAWCGAQTGPVSDGHNLQDFIAPPGTRQIYKPSMLHADLVTGYDRRAPLDSVVYTLDNGARCCRVMGLDSTWVVDYTWVYAHQGLPKRWYDAEDLLRVGDSLGIGDSSPIVLTFGTYRIGVHAGSLEQVRSEAKRLRPPVMPPALAGRLRLKLERAEQALERGAAASSSSAAKH